MLKTPKLFTSISLMSALIISGCATLPRQPESPKGAFNHVLLEGGELPAPTECVIKKRIAYTICLDDKSHLATWVAYRLTADAVHSEANQRKNNWRTDPDFPWLTSKIYLGSGYEKGHLAPAEDFEASKQAMDESFLYSNSAPQAGSFNRTLWLDIEKAARKLATAHGEVLIVTGPVLEDGLPLLRGAAAIPKRFWKSVLYVERGKLRASAWIASDSFKVRDQKVYAVSVDEVERATGLDLFAIYPDGVEKEFEAHNSADDGVTTAIQAQTGSP